MKISLLSIALFSIHLSYSQNPYQVQATSTEDETNEVTTEMQFVEQNFPFIHMVDWQPGMKFMVEPDYLGVSNRLSLKPPRKSSYSDQPLQKDYEWKTLTLLRKEERKGRSYFTFDCEGTQLIHEYPGNLDDLRGSMSFSNIDNLVYLDEVDQAKKLLLNKRLFIITNRWLKENSASGQIEVNKKFIPVTITDIGLGTQDGPAKIVFRTDYGKENFLNVRFSGVNADAGAIFGTNFTEAFTFEDPRANFPNISDEHWTLIQEGKVRLGITEEVAKLSWGKPEKINRTITASIIQEQWVYGSSYLYFENGILSDIQN